MSLEGDIIRKIKTFRKRINDMDFKVRQYLGNREKYRLPLWQELIEEVRRFENQHTGRRYGFGNTEIQMRLESLMDSLLIHERAWKRLFERDAEMAKAAYLEKKAEEESRSANPNPNT